MSIRLSLWSIHITVAIDRLLCAKSDISGVSYHLVLMLIEPLRTSLNDVATVMFHFQLFVPGFASRFGPVDANTFINASRVFHC